MQSLHNTRNITLNFKITRQQNKILLVARLKDQS